LPDQPLVRLGVPREERLYRQDHARCAEAALERAVLKESALNRIENAACRQSLDRRHRPAVELEGEGGAGRHRHTIDEHCAGAAHRLVAADFAAKKLQILAQHVGQHPTRRDGEPVASAVDCDSDLNCIGHAAALKLRCVKTAIMRRRYREVA
jgi:hypothetical protein